MSYVILQLAVTLDGYIARIDNRVDFLDEIDESFTSRFKSFLISIDTIIMGKKTYEVMLTLGDFPFKDKMIYVLSSQKSVNPDSFVTFTSENTINLVKRLEGNIWLFGGAKTIQSFLKDDLVDEMQLFIIPKMIGEGIPLFLEQKIESNWTLVSNEKFSNNLFVTYKK